MILVDASSWIRFLRTDGDPLARGRALDALDSEWARLCPIVQIEPWNGARGKREIHILNKLHLQFRNLPSILPFGGWPMKRHGN